MDNTEDLLLVICGTLVLIVLIVTIGVCTHYDSSVVCNNGVLVSCSGRGCDQAKACK
jgi:hypothetical protein